MIVSLWSEDYQFITKLVATRQARKLGRAVAASEWHADLCHTGRFCRLLTEPHLYTGGESKLHQIGVRCHLGQKSQAKRVAQAHANLRLVEVRQR